MSEFERSKQTIGGRSILVTSWFDDLRKTWRASAPAYAHLSVVTGMGQEVNDLRGAAVARLNRLLTAHFEERS